MWATRSGVIKTEDFASQFRKGPVELTKLCLEKAGVCALLAVAGKTGNLSCLFYKLGVWEEEGWVEAATTCVDKAGFMWPKGAKEAIEQLYVHSFCQNEFLLECPYS